MEIGFGRTLSLGFSSLGIFGLTFFFVLAVGFLFGRWILFLFDQKLAERFNGQELPWEVLSLDGRPWVLGFP